MKTQKFKYDVAVSFAGEDRSLVEEFVNILASQHVSVFYDSWEQASLWGKDLYQYLDLIYRQAAEYCVIFVSRHYVEKAWTKHELKSAQARAFQQNSEYILPIKLDETELPGIPGTIAYIDIRRVKIDEVANLLLEKLNRSNEPNLEDITDRLKSSNKSDRISALTEIAVFQLFDLLEPSIDIMLNDPFPEVRERAAWTIDNLKDERALTALIQAIHDDAFGVRSAAGWGLVHLGEKVAPYMKEISQTSDNPRAREMADLVLMNL
jgi:TIR domain/HEAT repeats